MHRKTQVLGRPLLALAIGAILQACGGGAGTDADSGGVNTSESSAAVTVFPGETGARGDVVLVRGSGFAADCDVQLAMAGSTLSATRTGGSGGFAVQTVIPANTADGEHMVTARADSGCDSPDVASAQLVVEPRPIINLLRTEGRPGGVVSVEGSGFCATNGCSPVTLLINGLPAAAGVVVGEDGTFAADALVPAVEAAGAIKVVALQSNGAGDELRAFGDIIVTVKPDVREGPL